jgi:hypothetical protein
MCAGAIDENMSHCNRRECEKVRAIAPRDPRLLDELQVGLVNKTGRGQSRSAIANSQLVMGD